MKKANSTKEISMYNLKRKRAPGNFMLEPNLVTMEIRRNVIKGVCPQARPHPGNPAIWEEKKMPKELYVPKEQQQIIAYANAI